MVGDGEVRTEGPARAQSVSGVCPCASMVVPARVGRAEYLCGRRWRESCRRWLKQRDDRSICENMDVRCRKQGGAGGIFLSTIGLYQGWNVQLHRCSNGCAISGVRGTGESNTTYLSHFSEIKLRDIFARQLFSREDIRTFCNCRTRTDVPRSAGRRAEDCGRSRGRS